MNGRNTFSEAPARPEQILAIFQDWQRLEFGERQTEILSFETTIGEWLNSADFLDWRTLSKSLNKFFETDFSNDDWRAVMKPEGKRTLRNVCELIASRATLPVLNEAKFLGGSCKTASAFLALRAKLQSSGIDVSTIRPSTRLENFLRLHTSVVGTAIVKLAPGRIRGVKVRNNLARRLFGWICLACLVALVLSGIVSAHFLSAGSSATLIVSLFGMVVASHFPPASVQIEGVETFADLSRMIALPNITRDSIE